MRQLPQGICSKGMPEEEMVEERRIMFYLNDSCMCTLVTEGSSGS